MKEAGYYKKASRFISFCYLSAFILLTGIMTNWFLTKAEFRCTCSQTPHFQIFIPGRNFTIRVQHNSALRDCWCKLQKDELRYVWIVFLWTIHCAACAVVWRKVNPQAWLLFSGPDEGLQPKLAAGPAVPLSGMGPGEGEEIPGGKKSGQRGAGLIPSPFRCPGDRWAWFR